jgi:hypothetical protein
VNKKALVLADLGSLQPGVFGIRGVVAGKLKLTLELECSSLVFALFEHLLILLQYLS